MSELTRDGKLICVARANGNFEVWDKETWSQVLVIAGTET